MSKKLNIIEAMKMPIGTRFELSNDDTTVILKAHEEGGECLYWENETGSLTQVYITDETINAKYILIQQPVSFMEAISKPSNRIKVDINELEYLDGTKEKLNKYMSLRQMFSMMEERLTNIGITDVINNGKWYIEESEDCSND